MQAYPTPGTIVAGRYRVEAMLGEGGMGAVFRATELNQNFPVALKFPAPEIAARPGMMGRFANEATAATRLACEHVVHTYGVEATEDGTPFIVMELLEGRDLDKIVETDAPMEPARAVHFALQLLRALQVAHHSGIVHRDLKPSNCFVVGHAGDPDWVKLIDFGITKIMGDDSRAMTRTSVSMGTPAYMSPEQAKSAKAADARSDLYSVGVILYEMLTRKRPYDGDSDNEIIVKICTEPPIPIRQVRPDLNATLAGAVERAIAKLPSGRFSSATTFADALKPLADLRSNGVIARLEAGPEGTPALNPAVPIGFGPGPIAFASTDPVAAGGSLDPAPPLVKGATAMMEPMAPFPAPTAPTPAPNPTGSGTAMMAPFPGPAATPEGSREPQRTLIGEPTPPPGALAAAPLPNAMPFAPAPAVTPAPMIPAAAPDYDDDGGGGGGRTALFVVLGLLAVALIGGGIYFATRGGGGSSGPTAQPATGGDEGGKKKKKKTKEPGATGPEEPDDDPAIKPTEATVPKPTVAPPTTGTPTPPKPSTTTTTTTLPSTTVVPSTIPSPSTSTSTKPYPSYLPPGWTFPSTTTTAPPTTTAPHPTAPPTTTTPTTIPTGPPIGPVPSGTKKKPKIGGL
ncbi:MAG: serine/threonine protein kinase [Myxococcales bacterium]|nr:serine/threonine protein kinase [Myxococcales bacterium]